MSINNTNITNAGFLSMHYKWVTKGFTISMHYNQEHDYTWERINMILTERIGPLYV